MSRFMIREGWSTVLLTAFIVWVAVWSIQQADWAENLGVLNYVMLAGLVAGFVVSKWRQVPAPILHAAALLCGVLVVIFGVTSFLPDTLGTRREKLDWLWDRAGTWFNQVISGDAADDLYIFVVFISALVFLLAYATMWFVLQARWIWAALLFPGMLLMINLGYSQRVPAALVVMYLFASIVLLARFSLMQRETIWRRGRVEYPDTLPWRGMWVASYLAVLVLIFGWAVPVSAQSNSINNFWRDVDGPWRTVETQFNDWFAGLRGPGGGGIGGFASFADSFDLGGPLQLSDAQVVNVEVDGPGGAPYLAAHRYNDYTGRGWQSDVNSTHPDSESIADFIAPQVELRPGESVPVASRFVGERERVTYTMELERTRGSIMYAPETFVSADIGSNLVLAWDQVEETVDIQEVSPEDLPAELEVIVGMLKELDLTPPPPPEPTPDPNATPVPEDEAAEATPTPTPRLLPLPEPPEVREERALLAERDIIVSYVMNPETYRVATMTYSGTLPVFDDVEAVYSRDGLESDDVYTVETLNTSATNEELRQAGQAYPHTVTTRYLQLPDSVTQRTRDLARETTAGATNPYDAAKAIELYLRENITYSENIPFPPDGTDVVDHVLFTDPRGYCEYYASAFVVMMRSIGIPARMTVGFFPTDEQDGEQYLYRELNAHAWPEVYFDGYGWVGFEPTSARPEVSRAPVENEGGAGADGENGELSALGEGNFAGGFPEDDIFFEDEFFPVGGGGTFQAQDSITAGEIISRVVIGLLMLLVVLILYLWLRGLRGLTPANQFYLKLSRGAGWGGVRREPWMTPHEYARRVGEHVPDSRVPATYLTDLYVQETYGNRAPAQAEILRARQAWFRLRGVLLKHFFSRLKPWSRHDNNERDEGDW